jgi:hypothetical protein
LETSSSQRSKEARVLSLSQKRRRSRLRRESMRSSLPADGSLTLRSPLTLANLLSTPMGMETLSLLWVGLSMDSIYSHIMLTPKVATISLNTNRSMEGL